MTSWLDRAPDQPAIIAPAPHLRTGSDQWRADVARIESMGFDVLAVSEHYTDGWALEPMATVAFAAAVSARLCIAPIVLNNDLRHPAILAKAISTIDVLSGGRAMLGLGAGWLAGDYEALGVRQDAAGIRLERLDEALRLIRAFFDHETVSFAGAHYRTDALEALPRPTRPGGPPVLVGAGGPKALRVAGRNADIVGIHITHTARGFDERAAQEMSLPRIAEKIDTAVGAAAEIGRAAPAFQLSPVLVSIDGTLSTGRRPVFTDYLLDHPDEFDGSPAVLIGTAAQVADKIARFSAELGVRLWHLGRDLDGIARVISTLRAQ